ncbi:hypothetical protein G2W53_026984 [Senna tora]|uniref:Putative plant transposon protein domain-containing protein n=1 Tax=Senna tora TaxID=362788 RepID=A0A834TI60_9FABA|nr:hypothetical protein G2W53_026984 [Senna tora]
MDKAPPKTAVGPLKSKARFERTRFASAIAKNWYNCLFSQSTIGIQERQLELDLEGDPDRSMIDTVDVLNWADFIKIPTTAGMLSVVQEFYANFANKDADERLFVRGKRVTITREIIRDFYKLPNTHADIDCAYAALMKHPKEELNYDKIGDNLRRTAEFGSNSWLKDSKAQYNNLLLSNFSVIAQAWLYFISCRLLLVSHRTELKALANRKLPNDEKTPSAPTLVFPRLITALCKRSEVVMPQTEIPFENPIIHLRRAIGKIWETRWGEHRPICYHDIFNNLSRSLRERAL